MINKFKVRQNCSYFKSGSSDVMRLVLSGANLLSNTEAALGGGGYL